MLNPTKNWKDYVFSWPTYLILGIALTDLVIRTEVLQPLITKFCKEKEAE